MTHNWVHALPSQAEFAEGQETNGWQILSCILSFKVKETQHDKSCESGLWSQTDLTLNPSSAAYQVLGLGHVI